MNDIDRVLDEEHSGRHAARLVRSVDDHLRSRLHDRPAHALDIVPDTQAVASVPRRMAERCFGDPGLVYSVTQRLTAPGIFDVGEALGGAPPGFAAPPGESLAHFIATHGQGVIVFNDLQAFPERAISTLAEIVDTGRAGEEGSASPSLAADRLAILAFARMALPSPRALMQRAGMQSPWDPSDEVPPSFAAVIESLARERYPEHFRYWVTSRFDGVDAGFAWDRYSDLVAHNLLDTALFGPPQNVPQLAPPALPALRDQVPDVQAIPPGASEDEPFDVFISYSWTRTAQDAAWLRDDLRARGLRVYFDKDNLDVGSVPEGEVKQVLIQHLSATVAAAKAWIVFAAALKPYLLPAGMDRDEALRRGLAMALQDGVLVAWSWQTLEMRHMGRRLVLGEQSAYVLAEDGTVDEAFGYGPIPGRAQITAHVERYLAGQGVAPPARGRRGEPNG